MSVSFPPCTAHASISETAPGSVAVRAHVHCLLVLPGAKPAVAGTPGMMGYGMAKAAVHQLVKSLASPGSGLPDLACVLGLLPVTLDTPMNRKFMPGADT